MNKSTKDLTHLESEAYYKLSLHEVTLSFGVETALIMEIINEGIVSTQKNENNELCFNDEDVKRIRQVICLNRDLGINFAGGALILDLLAEIDRLQALLKRV